jgi:hypothetical protein
MEIYKSDYVQVYFDDKTSLLEQKYSAKDFTSIKFVKEHREILELIKKIKPEKFLIDLTERETPINEVNEEWLLRGLMPEVVRGGLEKMAFIVNDEFNSPVSIEQIAEMQSKRIIVPQYFDDMEIAKDWLLNE